MSDLGKAYVQIIPSAQGISGSISQVLSPEATSAGTQAGNLIAGGIGTTLKSATGLLAAGVTAVSTAIIKGSSDVASYGDNIDKMSQKMGMSAQSYQEWDAVMQHSGTSMETMKSSMKTLANAAQTNSAAFEKLGISQKDLQSMSQEQLFEATITALQNVENETERTYLAGKTLGKGATELGALLNTSAEDTQAMRDRVHELGGVMSDEAVKAAAQFQDNLQDMQTAISGIGRGLVSEFLPSMNQILAGFTALIAGEEDATEQLSAGFSSLFDSLGGVADQVIQTITEMMPSLIEGIATILPQIIEMATSLIISFAQALVEQMPTLVTTVIPSLLSAAVELVVALGQALIEAAPQLFDAGVQLFEMFKSSFTSSDLLDKGQEMLDNVLSGITSKLPDILAKGVEIVTNIATGILNNLPQLITTAGNMISTFVSFMMQNMPTILQTGARLLLNLVNGIVNNLPQIVSSVARVIATFISTIGQNLPSILQQGIEIIGKLVVGLIQAIPEIISAMPQIISAIVDAFGDVDWAEIGLNLIQGIANGITNAVGWIIDAARDAAEAAFDAACSWLGINSPSKKGIWMGDMYVEGMAKGIRDSMDELTDVTDDLMDDTFGALTIPQPSYNTAQPTRPDGNVTVNMTINGAEGQDINALAEIIQDKINDAVYQRRAVYA